MSSASAWDRGPFIAPPAGGMLVLEPAQARLVARRVKTQLRRSVRLAVVEPPAEHLALVEPRPPVVRRRPVPCGLKPGATYRVHESPDRDPVALVVVSGVAVQRLGDMTTADAQAEGHGSMVGFVDWWLRRHDRAWPPQVEKLCSNCHGHAEFTDHEGELVACTVCDLGVVMVDAPLDPVAAAIHFDRFADRLAWVVSFALDDRRFLARRSQRGYTSDPREAMHGEPEVIGDPLPMWVARAEQQRRRDRADRDAARLSGLPSIDDQIAELKRLAATRDVDISSDLRVIEQRQRRGSPADQAVVAQRADAIARKVLRNPEAA